MPSHLMCMANRLIRARREISFRPDEVADYAGVSLERYQDLEAGRGEPTLPVLRAIAHLSGRTLDWLIEGCGPTHRQE